MPKLKGLLDSAKRKLGGLLGGLNEYNDAFNDRAYSLLGNAPQQFNAGAAAGTAGSLGDAAYIARLPEYMLKGSMPDPRTIPGTSDYIAAQAGVPAPEGFLENAAWIGGQLLAPGPGELGAAGMAGGKLAMFLGAKAKTAMPDVLEYAQAMEKAGKSADEIWQTTGKLGQPWFRGADGKWRFEISDDAAKLTPQAAKSFVPGLANLNNKFDASLPDFMTHEGVINAYPFAKNIGVKSDAGMAGGGGYMEAPSMLASDGTARQMRIAQAGSDPLSTGLHETQHAIQRGEGFSRGGSPDDFAGAPDMVDALTKEQDIIGETLEYLRRVDAGMSKKDAGIGLSRDAVANAMGFGSSAEAAQRAAEVEADISRWAEAAIDPMGAYRRLAGEAEARNVQSRMNLTMDERIALPPWVTQDVPTEQQIVRFGDGPAMAVEDFAARRAGKAKPYREAMGADTMPAMPKQEPTKPDYGITHRPPMRDSGAPLFDATGGGNVYPDDVYSAKAQQYYGTGDAKLDRETFRLLQSYRNEPDAPVTIYRAVPADVDATDINAGDWVTVNKAYADMHGQGFDGGYKIIKKQVKAKDIYTNGDSIHEWGYDPGGL